MAFSELTVMHGLCAPVMPILMMMMLMMIIVTAPLGYRVARSP